jgi:hypothetical protein
MSSLPTMVTWAEGWSVMRRYDPPHVHRHLEAQEVHEEVPRFGGCRSDLIFGTALLIFTVRVLSNDRPMRQRDPEARLVRRSAGGA